MLSIVTVDYEINHTTVNNIKFDSSETLLDADVVLLNTAVLDQTWTSNALTSSVDGKLEIYISSGSDRIRNLFDRRKAEITTLLDNGKVIFVLLSPKKDVRRQVTIPKGYTEPSKFGTLTNYDWLPKEATWIKNYIIVGKGSIVILADPSHPMAPYYRAFQGELDYAAYLKTDINDPTVFFLVLHQVTCVE